MNPTISDWLSDLGLSQYTTAFAGNDIDWALLPQLDQATLQAIGITSAGHRLRILSAARELGALDKKEAPTAERRQLTVMFCDLVGSTELSARLDPEDLRNLIRRYQECVESVVTRYGGHIAQYLGDGVLVYFGYPASFEDSALRAIFAALEIPSALDKSNATVEQEFGTSLSVRIGLHTGPVVVGAMGGTQRQENLALGQTPNQAARLQGLAEPNAIVISDATYQHVAGHIDITSLGEKNLKGIPEPVTAYVVQGRRQTQSRFRASAQQTLRRLVGRTDEMARLTRYWSQACAGDGQVVVVNGEAGIGKSRLTQEFLDNVENENLAGDTVRRVWLIQCSPHQSNTALSPVLRVVEQQACPDTNFSDIDKADQLKQWLSDQPTVRVNHPPANALASLLQLGGNTEDQLSEIQTLQQMQDWIHESWVSPVDHKSHLIVVEDVHWADPTTLLLLRRAVDSIASRRVLLLLTARPTFTESFGGAEHIKRIAINRMPVDQVIEIANDFAPADLELPPFLARAIAEKSDGVPLYVEEITRAVLGKNHSQLTSEDIRNPDLQDINVPTNLQDSLVARLDQTGTAKSIAQSAACIGRDFELGTLLAITPLDKDSVINCLKQLEDAEIVFRAMELGKPAYRFKHALIRDAAYESLLRSERHQLHQMIANHLSNIGTGERVTAPEILAHHCELAGDEEQALKHWAAAGARSVQTGSINEAASHFRRGIAVADRIEQQEPDTQRQTLSNMAITLRIELAALLPDLSGQGNPEAEAVCEQAIERALSLKAMDALFRATAIYAINQHYLGKKKSGMDALAKLPDPLPAQLTDRSLVDLFAAKHVYPKQREQKIQHPKLANRAAAMAGALLENNPDDYMLARRRGEAVGWIFSDRYMQGDFAQCDLTSAQLSEIADATRHEATLSAILGTLGFHLTRKNDLKSLLPVAQLSREYAIKQQIDTRVHRGNLLVGVGLLGTDQVHEGLSLIRQVFERQKNWYARQGTVYFLQYACEALADNNFIDAMTPITRFVVGLIDELVAVGNAQRPIDQATIMRHQGLIDANDGSESDAREKLTHAIKALPASGRNTMVLKLRTDLFKISGDPKDKDGLVAQVLLYDDQPEWPVLRHAREVLDE